MDIDPNTKREILQSLLRTRSPHKTAKKTGYDISVVLQVYDAERNPHPPRKERWGGDGRPDLRQYLVAKKNAWEEWDNNDPAVRELREDYEAGVRLMATGRDGNWLLLYGIPAITVTPRPGFFIPEC